MPQMSLTVTCEGGDLKMYNFILQMLYHYIEVSPKDRKEGKARVEKVYKPTEEGWKGENWWGTYVLTLFIPCIIHSIVSPCP